MCLDAQAATAWVNGDDWCDVIAPVLGGADQDDAVWCFPFTDFDDQHKLLLWRSPNQVAVRDWCQMAAQRIRQTQHPLPAILHERLPHDPQASPLVTSHDHWLDDLVQRIQAHIAIIEAARTRLESQCLPPPALFASAFADETAMRDGARFNQTYTRRPTPAPSSN